MKHFFVFSVLTMSMITFSCSPKPIEEEVIPIENPALWGSWEVTAVHWITKDTTYSVNEAQPGIFMFNESRYSIQWTPDGNPRTPFEILSKPTDEELIAGFRSVVFNAGTYEMTDSIVTATAVIAKVPGFEGGKQFYRYTINGDKLELTMFDETYPDGTKPSWSGRYETKFVMERAVAQ